MGHWQTWSSQTGTDNSHDSDVIHPFRSVRGAPLPPAACSDHCLDSAENPTGANRIDHGQTRQPSTHNPVVQLNTALVYGDC